MLELLSAYSLSSIIVIVIMAAIAIKESICFIDWIKGKNEKSYQNRQDKEIQMDAINQRFSNGSKHFHSLFERQDELEKTQKEILEKINLLIESDKDDIKAYITREYHHFYEEKKWIDDYSLDCIERRFEHYKAENGNSFIEGMVDKIRTLPRYPQ